ncbi:MAG: hypothetical protein ACRDV9_15085 [Acidimicrobiia bacterium]
MSEIDLRSPKPGASTAQRSTALALLHAAQEACSDASLPTTEARGLAAALAWDAESQLARLDPESPAPCDQPEALVVEDRRDPGSSVSDRSPAPFPGNASCPPEARTPQGPRLATVSVGVTDVGVTDGIQEDLVTSLVALGFLAEAVDEPEVWAKTQTGGVLLFSNGLPEAPTSLAHLKTGDPDLVVVVLLAGIGVPSIRAALSSGADGVADRDASPAEVGRVILAAIDGHFTFPRRIARELWADNSGPGGNLQISEAEVAWLRMLADGATVPAVARSANRSERDMFRLLKRLYGRLEATSRTEAILKAAQAGLLSDRPASTPQS